MLDEQINLNLELPNPIDIRFYAPYLLSGLQAFAENDIRFYLKNSTSPIMFETAQQDECSITYLVMPVSPTVP